MPLKTTTPAVVDHSKVADAVRALQNLSDHELATAVSLLSCDYGFDFASTMSTMYYLFTTPRASWEVRSGKLRQQADGPVGNTRTSFAMLPPGATFTFVGLALRFTKETDFVARGYRAGGSFIVSAAYGEFSTDALVDII